MSESQDSQAQAVHDRLVALLSETWNDEQVEDVFGPRCATVSRLSFVRATDSCAYSPASAEDSQPRVDALSLELWRFSTLANLYQPILTRIVDASESSAVVQRTKALRAISLVVAQDPDLFHQDNIRRSIENRMLDSSPQVRDTAIELVGKYVVSRPDLAVQYLPRLSERISDTGLGVRRRVIKLLRVLYHALPDDKYKVDISRKLVYRVFDEDDGIKARLRFCPGLRISRPRLTDCLSRTQELAVETIEEVWFGAPSKSAAQDPAASLAQLAGIITQTAGVFKDRPPPVDEALRLIMAKHAEKGTQPPLERLKLIMESLIDGLVEDERGMVGPPPFASLTLPA